MRFRTMLFLATLAAAGTFAPASRALAASSGIDSPVPAAVGTTPAAGCPQFFVAFDLARIDACAKALAPSGWGLTAVQSGAGLDRPPNRYDGFFAAASPMRTLEADEDDVDITSDTRYGDVAGLLYDTMEHRAVWVRQRGLSNRPCHVELVFDQTMKPRTYAQLVSEQAARGCVPAVAATYNPGIEDETEETVELFVRGDPHAIGSQIHGSDADFAAFEKRARARGFQRLKLGREPDLFGLVSGTTSVERIPFGRGADRYAALAARLASAARTGERAIDLEVDLYDGYVDVLWLAKKS